MISNLRRMNYSCFPVERELEAKSVFLVVLVAGKLSSEIMELQSNGDIQTVMIG